MGLEYRIVTLQLKSTPHQRTTSRGPLAYFSNSIINVGISGLSASNAAWVSRSHALALHNPSLSSLYRLNATQATQLATDPDVDLVIVGVKPPLHYELAIPLLEAGKDVFVEGPLATKLEQVTALQAAARRGGRHTLVALQARAAPVILKAKETTDSGALGKIVATNIVGWDNSLLYLPARFDCEHDAKNPGISPPPPATSLTQCASSSASSRACHLRSTASSLLLAHLTTRHHEDGVKRDAPDLILV
ncbi:hypothetical protein BDW68DRAFT_183641 [Aspergillus falconensis]